MDGPSLGINIYVGGMRDENLEDFKRVTGSDGLCVSRDLW